MLCTFTQRRRIFAPSVLSALSGLPVLRVPAPVDLAIASHFLTKLHSVMNTLITKLHYTCRVMFWYLEYNIVTVKLIDQLQWENDKDLCRFSPTHLLNRFPSFLLFVAVV